MKFKLTTWILIAMLAGIAVGWMCHALLPTPEAAKTVAGYISLMTDVFLRLIKIIIALLGLIRRRSGILRRQSHGRHRLGRAGFARDAEGDCLRDGVGTDRRVCGHGFHRRNARSRHSVDVRQIHGRVLPRHLYPLGIAR